MTLTEQQVTPAQHFVFYGVDWAYYEHTLDVLFKAGSNAHVTYDSGVMEIMTTGDKHGRAKTALASVIETYALEADVPVTGMGAVTCKREDLDKGLDPDECYYVNSPLPPMPAESEPLDLQAFPPPDLAIEIDVSRSSIPKQPIYAALGVAEVWRYSSGRLIYLGLNASGKYSPIDQSIAFPNLPLEKVNEFLALGLNRSQHEAAKAMRDWARKEGK